MLSPYEYKSAYEAQKRENTSLKARIKELEKQNSSLQFSLQCEATDRVELLEVLEDIRDSNNFTYIHIEIDKVLNRAKKIKQIKK